MYLLETSGVLFLQIRLAHPSVTQLHLKLANRYTLYALLLHHIMLVYGLSVILPTAGGLDIVVRKIANHKASESSQGSTLPSLQLLHPRLQPNTALILASGSSYAFIIVVVDDWPISHVKGKLMYVTLRIELHGGQRLAACRTTPRASYRQSATINRWPSMRTRS